MPHDPLLRFTLCATSAGVNVAGGFQVLAGDLELLTEFDYAARAANSPTFHIHHPVAATGLVDDIAVWLRGQAAAGTETPDQREEWLRRHASQLGGPEFPPPPPPPPPPRVRPVPMRVPPRLPRRAATRIAQTPPNLGWAYALFPALGGVIMGGTFLLLSLLAAVTPVASGNSESGGRLAVGGAILSLGLMAGGIVWTATLLGWRWRRNRP